MPFSLIQELLRVSVSMVFRISPHKSVFLNHDSLPLSKLPPYLSPSLLIKRFVILLRWSFQSPGVWPPTQSTATTAASAAATTRTPWPTAYRGREVGYRDVFINDAVK